MDENQRQAIDLIAQACELMGWQIVLPAENQDEDLYYLVIGTPEGTEMVTKRINGDFQ